MTSQKAKCLCKCINILFVSDKMAPGGEKRERGHQIFKTNCAYFLKRREKANFNLKFIEFCKNRKYYEVMRIIVNPSLLSVFPPIFLLLLLLPRLLTSSKIYDHPWLWSTVYAFYVTALNRYITIVIGLLLSPPQLNSWVWNFVNSLGICSVKFSH